MSDPRIFNAETQDDFRLALKSYDPEKIQKIVIGKLEDDPQDFDGLEDFLSHPFPHLTHLYLWRIGRLERLSGTFDQLECLDVRGCKDLTTIETTLSSHLETLDVGDCTALEDLPRHGPAGLARLYVNGCTKLKARAIDNLLADASSGDFEEFDAAGCPGLVDLDEVPLSARKMVLRGCPELKDVSRIADLRQLRHLDLGSCPRVTALPEIASELQYLHLHGSDALVEFMGQGIGAYDRGVQEGQNVADRLHSRRKFGAHLMAAAHAKLLFLGDGRVGKTTLSKCLLWRTLDEKTRAAHPELEPSGNEDPTHKLRFAKWETRVELPKEYRETVAERAKARHLALDMDEEGSVPGTVRIWDFGGQEIYRNTHRLFAGEGAVFVIVWNEEPPDSAAIERERPEACDPGVWNGLNRRRSIDYWLDYVASLREDASVALVCTRCDPNATSRPTVQLAERHEGRDLALFFVNGLAEKHTDATEMRRLERWISQRCGREAARIEVLQPSFFHDVASHVDALIRENDEQRQADRQPPHSLLSWSEWSGRVRGLGGHGEIEERDVEAITGYLHDAGLLHAAREGADRSVIVDLNWATELIYAMLRPAGRLHRQIIANGGWLPRVELEGEAQWKLLSDDTQRQRLLDYLEQSRILVKVLSREESRDGEEVFVANEALLLPSFEKVADRLRTRMELVRERPGSATLEAFVFETEPVSELGLRDILARFGARFGRAATWFKTGMQVASDDGSWCFFLAWVPKAEDEFWGHVDARLVGPKKDLERLGSVFEEVFFGTEGERERLVRVGRRAAEEIDLSLERLFPPRPRVAGHGDVAISSSGADGDDVAELVRQLEVKGIRDPVWYRRRECRADEYEEVMHFMKEGLGRAGCLVLVLSDSYLGTDPARNWYCHWELADAIVAVAEGRRLIERTFVVYQQGGVVDSGNVCDRVVKNFNSLCEYFADLYSSQAARDKRNFKFYDTASQDFARALEDGRVGAFFERRGDLGAYQHLKDEQGNVDATELIAAISRAWKNLT